MQVPSRKLQRNFTSCKFILWVGKNYELQVPSVGTRFQLKLTILNFGNKFAKKGDFPAENGKSEHRQWILHIRISLGTKFQLKLKILNFLTKLTQKRIFFSLSQKKWRPPLILHLRISPGVKLQFKLTILNFGTKFAPKGYYQWKTEKLHITVKFCIFELVQVPNLSLNWPFWFSDPPCSKRVFPV